MKRIAFWSLPAALVLACAASGAPAGESAEPDAGKTLAGDASVDATFGDASADAAADADAAATPIDCSTVAFCPESTPLSALVSLNAVWGTGPDDVWAVGTRGSVLHRENGAFVAYDSGVKEIFFGIWGAGPTSDPWVLSGSAPYRLHRADHTFEPALGADYTKNPYFNERLWALGGSSDTDVVLAGQSSTAFAQLTASLWTLRSTGDLAWVPTPTRRDGFDDYPTLRAVFVGSPSYAWAVSDDGRSYQRTFVTPDPGDESDDAGAPAPTPVWQYVATAASRPLESIWASGPDDVWAVGAYGTIQHLDATGAWHLSPSPTAVSLHALWGSSPTDIWAVGDAGTIIHFDGDGWSHATAAFSSDVVADLYGVWGSGPRDVYVVGSRGVLHRTSESGSIP